MRGPFDDWFQKFGSGIENLENKPRGRSRSTLNEDESKGKTEAVSRTCVSNETVSDIRAYTSEAKKLEE